VFLNSIEGTLPQVRRSLAEPAIPENRLGGVVFFSMANPDVAVAANPLSLPPGQNTPRRGFAEFASGLVTGKSVDGSTPYEDPIANPLAVFSYPVPVPVHPWKANPQVGHLKGFVKNEAGAVVDTGAIRIERQETGTPPAGRTFVVNATDGGGFYGGVDLVPGTYRVTVTPVGAAPFTSCPATVTAGAVTTLDVTIDRDAPTATLTADPGTIWPPNGQMVTVTLAGTAADVGTGLASVSFRVLDEYGRIEPSVAALTSAEVQKGQWSRTLQLEASRLEEDKDGRTYSIEATLTDAACNTRLVRTTVVVLHDRRGGA
jgi:hypothetical protein